MKNAMAKYEYAEISDTKFHHTLICRLLTTRISTFTALLTMDFLNLLTPNDDYSGRTAPVTSKCCISYIYSRIIGTEYFKHGIYSPFFLFKMHLFHNSNIFGSCFIHILYTGCAKIKKIIPVPKG